MFNSTDLDLSIMVLALVDSVNFVTRVSARKRYFQATYFEARDPRPFSQVLAGRRRARR